MPIVYDPLRIFETPKGVSQLTAATLAAGVANNQTLVAAVSGQRVRVMGWIAQSSTAAIGLFSLKDGNAGTVLMQPLAVPVITAGANDKLPIVESGYFETSTGVGLFTDVTTAAVNITIFYIAYTP